MIGLELAVGQVPHLVTQITHNVTSVFTNPGLGWLMDGS